MSEAKVGIVGAGGVGTACLVAMTLRGSAREIVLVNRDEKRSRAVIADLQYGALLAAPVTLRAGDYRDLAGCAVVAITAGLNEQRGGATNRDDPAGRLRLLAKNAQIYREIVPRIAAAAPESILLVVTDPPDPLADVARGVAKRSQVLSTGTFLDTLRFRHHLAVRIGIDARSVDAMVLGEHGMSQVFAWSCARIGGTAVIPTLLPRGVGVEAFRNEVEKDVRFANIDIIEGTGASRLGIGVAVARIVEIIARDERAVIPIGAYQEPFGVTLSLPCAVGRGGVAGVVPITLSTPEESALRRSAEVLRQARASLS